METKYKIDDNIVFMKDNKVRIEKINGISTYQGKINELHKQWDVEKGNVEIIYHCGMFCEVNELNVYKSVDDLKEALFSKIQNS